MDLFTKKILGVEFDLPKLRVAELQLGKPFKLLQFSELDYSFFGEDELLKVLKTKFRARNVVLTAPLNSAGHQVEHFPLTEQELAKVIPSEARKLSMLEPDDLAFDYQILGQARQGTPRQLETLIVTASRGELLERASLFQQGGFKLKKLTTIPVALLNSIRMQGDRWGDETLLGVHVGHRALNILVAEQGRFMFSVEAAVDLKDFAGSEKAYLPRLSSEIKRSLIYFNQRFRGSHIQRILLSGQGNLRELTGPFLDAFGLEVELLEPEGWLDISPLEKEVPEARAVLPALAAIVGAVSDAPSSLAIDLSKGLRPGRKGSEAAAAPLRLGKIPLAAGALAVSLMGGVYVYFDMSASGVRKNVDGVMSQIQALQQRIAQGRAEMEGRQTAERHAQLFRNAAAAGRILSVMLKSVSVAAPGNMRLTHLEVQPKNTQWEVILQGEVLAEDAAVATLEFGSFMQEIRKNPLVREHAYRKPIGTLSDSTKLVFDLSLTVGM